MNTTLLARMLEISRQMAETRDIDQLLQLAMNEVSSIMGAEFGYLVLIDAGGELQFRVRTGEIREDMGEEGDELSLTIFNDVIKIGEPIIVRDALSDNDYSSRSSVVNLRLRSVMCVPLISRGNILGALYLENRKIRAAFSEEDLEPFTFFANQAAVSIENALLINNLENLVAERTAQVEHSWREAVEANKMRTTLLGQLAHDMRSPVSVVKLSLSMVTSEKLGAVNETQADWLGRATLSINHMDNLIQNIFDLSKMEMGRLEIVREQLNIREFLKRVYDIGLALPWAENVEFECELPNNLPEIEIDPVRIQQVLLNLIGNALKFTVQGEVILHADVYEAGEICIGVRDTGEGIPDDLCERVFDRFQQFDQDSNRRRQGGGLGLAICRELVEKHDGRIWVTSTHGKGSDFIFSLPI
jgi:signal transduction histidine kinase